MLIANTPLASYKIILPAAALEGERDAAEVLRDTLTRATGVTLSIDTDATPAADCEIVIGQTNRDTDKVIAVFLGIFILIKAVIYEIFTEIIRIFN